MRPTAISAGLRSGAILGVAALLLALLGLNPRFSWIPEAFLITIAVALPLLILGWTGHHVALQTTSQSQAALSGAVAGLLGGLVGGLAYLVSGKPALNLVVGTVLGAIVGSVAAATGALVVRKRETGSR